MKDQVSTITLDTTPAVTTVAKPLQLIGAFLLGAVVVYGAGFLNTPAVHNAAHDARHSQGFPCH